MSGKQLYGKTALTTGALAALQNDPPKCTLEVSAVENKTLRWG